VSSSAVTMLTRSRKSASPIVPSLKHSFSMRS
jgi:hypothetical protein